MKNTQHYSLETGFEDYERLSILNKYYNPGSRELLRKANLHPSAKILDIGCGHGEMTRIIAQDIISSGHIVGIERDSKQITVASNKLIDCANVTLICNDIFALNLPTESFDCVYCRLLLMHLANPKGALNKMKCLLKPGGKLICEVGDVRGLRYIPSLPNFEKWMIYWFNLGKSLGTSYDFCDYTWATLRELGLELEVFQINQPVSWQQDAKMLHVLGFQQLIDQYLESGGATKSDIEELTQINSTLLADPNTYVELYRMNQFVAIKPFSNPIHTRD
jgi:ubiquinone/menaquinone biosynthesis C-methylase UbiE